MDLLATASPMWGHPLIGPGGECLRVPHWAYGQLIKLGAKKRYSIQLSPIIYELMRPEFDAVREGYSRSHGQGKKRRRTVTSQSLARLLGPDLSGPSWCVCKCRECQEREAQADHTDEPGLMRVRASMEADNAIASMHKGAQCR